jgi:D-tyrosyl-tRNA(Tyr) deacylase
VRALVQRVSQAAVRVDGETLGEIGPGLLILVCAMQGDDDSKPRLLAEKLSKLRIFKDEAGKMNLSLKDTGGSALVVSQFTLAADTSRGHRPSFSGVADPVRGRALYERVVETAARRHRGVVACGEFGADMQVALVNDGPVTIPLTVRG